LGGQWKEKGETEFLPTENEGKEGNVKKERSKKKNGGLGKEKIERGKVSLRATSLSRGGTYRRTGREKTNKIDTTIRKGIFG